MKDLITEDDLEWQRRFRKRQARRSSRIKRWNKWQRLAKKFPKKWQIIKLNNLEWTVALMKKGDCYEIMTMGMRIEGMPEI